MAGLIDIVHAALPLSSNFLLAHTGVECTFGEAPLHAELQVRSGASVNFVTLVFDFRSEHGKKKVYTGP